MARRTQQERLYADRYCADGVISDGWRKVRKHGDTARVKFNGDWWESDQLIPHVGDTVFVRMNDYWCQSVVIRPGCIGAMGQSFLAYSK